VAGSRPTWWKHPRAPISTRSTRSCVSVSAATPAPPKSGREPMSGVVNRWVEPQWATDYLEKRDSMPHRAEGHAALLELLGGEVERILDLGTGDGYLLGRVLAVYPDAVGIGLDFSAEMLTRARASFGSDPCVEIIEHNLDDSLPAQLGE